MRPLAIRGFLELWGHWIAFTIALIALATVAEANNPTTQPVAPPALIITGGTLPDTVVSAVKSLFEDGPAPMADPRGKEYREVTIQVSEQSNGGVFEFVTHAWVIDPSAEPPQAICWNGLVYSVLKLGPVMDIENDVKSVIEAKHAEIKLSKRIGHNDLLRENRAEKDAVAWEALDVQQIVMLARLGRLDLAQLVWDTFMAEIGDDHWNPAFDYDFLDKIRINRAWDLNYRAETAFERGEDDAALRDARASAGVTNGIIPSDYDYQFGWRMKLMQARSASVLAEMERRAKIAPYDPVLLHPEKYPDKQARIAALIRDIELVGEQPMGSSDKLQIIPSVMEDMLVAEGDDAVEPLLDCAGNDIRMTRCAASSGALFGRSNVYFQPVRDIALAAAERIAGFAASPKPQSLFRDTPSEDARRANLKIFRTRWEKLQQIPSWKRQYAVLADDTMDLSMWLEAAEYIAGTEYTDRFGFSLKDDPAWHVACDRLKALGKNEPSVRDLLVKRARALRAAPDGRASPDNGIDENARAAREFLACLVHWDGRASLDELRAYGNNLRNVPGFLCTRISFGDSDAWGQYARFIKTRDEVDCMDNFLLEPLWRYPDDPSATEIQRWIWNDKASPFNPLVSAQTGCSCDPEIVASTFLGSRIFQQHLLSLLDDRREIEQSTITVEASGKMEVGVPGDRFWAQRTRVDAADVTRLAGKTVPTRVCDVVADRISEIHGAPQFEFYWEQDRRDAAVKECKEFLTRFGERLVQGAVDVATANNSRPDTIPGLEPFFIFLPKVAVVFPPLAAPATPAQAANGEAIFTLANEGTTQKADLKLPIRGRWFTNAGVRTDAYSDSQWIHYDDNEGTIWQAEDLTKDGKTQRYFGFVWAGGINRVPAEQMEFRDDWTAGRSELSGGVNAALLPPGKDVVADRDLPVGQPVMFTLHLRNRRAVPQTIDERLLERDSTSSAIRLRDGVMIHVRRARPGATKDYAVRLYMTADELTPRVPIEHFSAKLGDAPAQMRKPREDFDAFSIDLRDLFDLSQPGYYAVWMTFDPNIAPYAGETQPVPFTIAAK